MGNRLHFNFDFGSINFERLKKLATRIADIVSTANQGPGFDPELTQLANEFKRAMHAATIQTQAKARSLTLTGLPGGDFQGVVGGC